MQEGIGGRQFDGGEQTQKHTADSRWGRLTVCRGTGGWLFGQERQGLLPSPVKGGNWGIPPPPLGGDGPAGNRIAGAAELPVLQGAGGKGILRVHLLDLRGGVVSEKVKEERAQGQCHLHEPLVSGVPVVQLAQCGGIC